MDSPRMPLSRSQNDLYNTQVNVQDEGGVDKVYDDPTNAVMAGRALEDTGREVILCQSIERNLSDSTTVNSYL